MILSNLSVSRLRGVHPDLVRVVLRCADDWKDADTGFIITCGVRTLAEQKVLVAKGASKTLRSRHIPAANGYAHAVDLAATIDGRVRWDWPLYDRLAKP
jgi:peptidoglycan LD-endopeptidase CwlK